MKKLVLTSLAKQDLRAIRKYIALDSPDEARRFAADLAAKITWMAKVDFKGAPRDNISEGLRSFPYRKRCIYFRLSDDCLTVIRVLHSRQDLNRQSFDENQDD